MFFDSHIHTKTKESGGFIIGLEGSPKFADTMNNQQALTYHSPQNGYVSYFYVTKNMLHEVIEHKFLKYHPRREHYTPEQVIQSIYLNKPHCVMIDTLNEPYWQPYDYWQIARIFPDIIFIFPHSGGYLINDFIKICHFQKNIWIDFSLTHTVLGGLGKGLAYINDAILYSCKSAFAERVLLGSDAPFFNQQDVVDFYRRFDLIDSLNLNFKKLLEKINEIK